MADATVELEASLDRVISAVQDQVFEPTPESPHQLGIGLGRFHYNECNPPRSIH